MVNLGSNSRIRLRYLRMQISLLRDLRNAHSILDQAKLSHRIWTAHNPKLPKLHCLLMFSRSVHRQLLLLPKCREFNKIRKGKMYRFHITSKIRTKTIQTVDKMTLFTRLRKSRENFRVSSQLKKEMVLRWPAPYRRTKEILESNLRAKAIKRVKIISRFSLVELLTPIKVSSHRTLNKRATQTSKRRIQMLIQNRWPPIQVLKCLCWVTTLSRFLKTWWKRMSRVTRTKTTNQVPKESLLPDLSLEFQDILATCKVGSVTSLSNGNALQVGRKSPIRL